jgi:hypothetical protein
VGSAQQYQGSVIPAPEELEPTPEELAFVEQSRRLGGVVPLPMSPKLATR